MPMITTPTLLKQTYRVESLEPFGLLIDGGNEHSVEDIDKSLLYRMALSEKVILLRNFKSLEKEEFHRFCLSFPNKKLLHWESGPVMEMKVSENPANYLFSTEKVPFHWDGAFHTSPSFLMFQCITPPPRSAGGETLFAHTELILKETPPEKKAHWENIQLSYQTEKKAHYGGEISVPMVQSHPETGNPILRYAEAVETQLNPVTLSISGIPEKEAPAFKESMSQLLYDPHFCYEHQWEEGDILMCDNHSLVHGRNAFKENSPRHLRRIQIL